MRALILAVACVASLAFLSGNAGAQATTDPVALVDPFVGTSGTSVGGPIDDFPGADAPFGMLQWSPDTPTSPASGGYDYRDAAITGFSLTHISGAGCDAFNDFRITPTIGPIVDPRNVKLAFTHADETASPGYYAVSLGSPATRVQLAVTPRTGLGAFTFAPTTQANLLINVASDQAGPTDATFRVTGANEIGGSVTSGAFCGMPDVFTAYVVIRFDRPFASYGTWRGDALEPGSASARGPQSGGWVTFDTTRDRTVRAQVSVSWVSLDGARANLDAEATTWDVDAVRAATAARWRHYLGEIQVTGGTPEQQRTFYTAVYHALLHPNLFSDADGRYGGFDGRVHRVAAGHAEYANYSGWDIYRTQVPLVALLAPRESSDMMRSMVDASAQMGWLPKWPLANGESNVMGGDSADPILAGAYAFGAHDFDARAALRAMVKGATDTTSPPGQGWYVEREGLSEYLHGGFVTNAHTTDVSPEPNGASITLEYSLDDFAIAQLARALGDKKTSLTFMHRSQNWSNLFDRATGLIAPRDADGAFVQTPLTANGQSGFQEGNAWQYTWMVPQDLGGLVYAMGGPSVARARLDSFFTQINAGQDKPYAWYGNEPSLASVWTYLYAGAPYREQAIARNILTTLYADAPDGIPGNDDLGTMSAWYAWNAMGVYPIDPSVPLLLVGTPLFTHVAVHSPNGTAIVIDAPQAGSNGPYVQALRVNGRATTRPWIRLPSGRRVELAFDLGSQPNARWGSSPADAPPSYGMGPLTFPAASNLAVHAPAANVALAPGASATLAYSITNPSADTTRVTYHVSAPAGLQVAPTAGSVVVGPNAQVPISIGVTASQASGLYAVPIFGRAQNGALLTHATAVVRVAGGMLPLGFVANFTDDSITPFDPGTHSSGHAIPVGKNPGGIALDPHGTRVYVANQSSNDVTVVDSQTEQVVATVKVGKVPAGIRVNPDGTTVWVANYGDDTAQAIDTRSLTASAAVKVGRHPEDLAISPDGKTVYVVNQGGNSVTPIDVAARAPRAPIPVGARPLGIVVSHDGSRLYVTDTGDGGVSVVDAHTGALAATIPVGKIPQGLALSPDGSLLLVANSGSGDVTPIDTSTNRARAPIRVGSGPFDVAFAADGKTAFAVNTGDNECVPIDVARGRTLAPIPTASFPIAIALPQ